MQTDQPRVEEVASGNIVEKEVQPPTPPKRKKKKVSFAVWWALHEAEELKKSAENIEQQDSSVVTENEPSAKTLERVDQKGDGQPPESQSSEKNEVPFKTRMEEHVPADQEISATNIKKHSQVIVEESIAGVQETVDIAEKEEPAKSEEQPTKTRRSKKKMIPFHIWLEKHAPTEDNSLVTEQESISVLKEKPEKEESSSKSSAENIIKQNTSLPEEGGDQENNLKETCNEEPVILTTEPVTKKKSVTEMQKKADPKGEKQSKAKRIKKTPLLWKSFPEPGARIDLTFFSENSDIDNGFQANKQNYPGALPSSRKKTLWKIFPNSEPRVDVSFFADNIDTQNVSMPAQESDEAASLKKESYSTNTVISTSQTKCMCLAKSKESEYIEVQNYLMKQLDEMFDLNNKLIAELKQQKDLMKKVRSERRQKKKPMVSVAIQTDSQDTSQQKHVYQSALTQKEMEVSETRRHLKPLRQTTTPQTEITVLDTRRHLEPVHQSFSTQTELLLLLRKQPSVKQPSAHEDRQTTVFKRSTGENSRQSAMKAASELETLSTENISRANSEQQDMPVPKIVGKQTVTIKNDNHTNDTDIGKLQQITGEETVSTTQPNGDQQEVKKPSRKSKWRMKRKAAIRAVSELENLTNDKVSQDNTEIVPEIVDDQAASIKTEIHTNEMVIGNLQQVIEQETVSTAQLNDDHQDENKPLKKSRKKNKRKKRKAAITQEKAVSELEILNIENVSSENSEKPEVYVVETVADQIASLKNEIHMIQPTISTHQHVSEEVINSEIQKSEDQKVKKRLSKKYEQKKKRKAALRAASKLETPNNFNTEQEQVSVPVIAEGQKATIKTDSQTNELVIGKLQQATGEETVSEKQQNEEGKKKPSKKSKKKKKKKMAIKTEIETIVKTTETDKTLVPNVNIPKSDSEIIPEIPQIIETKFCTTSEDLPGNALVVSIEGESDITEELRTSPPKTKVTLNEDVNHSTPQEPEPQAAKEPAEEKNISEPEERPTKKISLWRRIKKALTPTPLRQFKDRCKVHPA